MIITVTLNPALDKTVTLPGFAVNTVNRVQSIRLDPGGKGINVSIIMGHLGVENVALGFVAGFTGQEMEQGIKQQGVQTDF